MRLFNVLNDQNPRTIAARVLGRRNRGDYVEHLLEKALGETSLSGQDRALCQELVYGVVRWQATLDWLIARKTTGRVQKPALQTLLRLGLYQLFWLSRVPDHAAVHETVEEAKRGGFGPQAGFVNALLRGYIREMDATRAALESLREAQPHLGLSHPEWLVKRWLARFGAPATRQLLEWNNTPPPTFARVNTLKGDAGSLVTQWRDENVEYDFVRRDWIEENLAFELKAHPLLTRLPSFQQGRFYVQDPSTLLAVSFLEARPGESVLDLCAAPGGKLSYLAQLMDNKGLIVAHEPLAERLKLIEENRARLGFQCRIITKLDETTFDRILVDAPCSNTGVMRRRVDLRWRIQSVEIDRLKATQLDLLRQATKLIKHSGTIVYSTCSLEPEENGDVVRQFLTENPGVSLEAERTLLPFNDHVDGAYVARLRSP
jgi:16S rRNA (cytosine967-C5)-methyltransferase